MNGCLPAGVHDASMLELRERFGRFQRSDRRVQLQKKLEEYMAEARASGQVTALIVNGSFTTAKDELGDIDLVVVLRSAADFRAGP